jgi:small subunit ribosomal protein S21
MRNNKDDFEISREETIKKFLQGGGELEVKTIKNHLDDSYLDDFTPLEVKVFNNNFDRAFKSFRQMVQKERILTLYKQKQSYEKPSVKRRRKRNEMRQKRMELEAKRQKILSGEFEKELQKKQKAKEVKRQLRAERNSNQE